MKSNMNHSFAQVPKANIQRSSFNRSSGFKSTFDGGILYPFFCDEALPGDTFNLRTDGFCRLSTPIYPVMDNMHLETFYFAVPIRLVWDNFQKMMGEQTNPNDSTDYIVPTVVPPAGGYQPDSLYDHFGIPTLVENLEISALPMRCYNLIFNEWFRDQNLQDSVPFSTADGSSSDTSFILRRRGKRHDYFTSSLPWPQKGPAVDLPLGDSATVQPIDGTHYFASDELGAMNLQQGIGVSNVLHTNGASATTNDPIFPTMEADLTNATAATINQLRQAFQIQKMYEKDARGGTRYTEIIRSHFNVTSPDARLQRPEFLGGGSTPVNITPLASTSSLDGVPDGRELASLSGIGTSSFSGHGFTKSFTEHCYIIGLYSVRADLTYQQGLNRLWTRSDRLDFYWPSLSQIGEQSVLNKEIYAQGTPEDDDVFGYQERYAEYRYKPSLVTGAFRSNHPTSLDAWHLSQDFGSLPSLNNVFIEDNPPIDRVIAVPSEPAFIGDFYHNLITARPMPLYGVPGNMDRF